MLHFTDRSDNVDYINVVQSLLTLCEERNHEMPLQARVAYSREGVSFHHLEGIQSLISSACFVSVCLLNNITYPT